MREIDAIPLSKLKGINVYYENDLYDVAFLILKLRDARAKHELSNTRSRPTVNGLVRDFASLIDPSMPDEKTVFSAIEKCKFPLNVGIEFDEDFDC
jgi:hypothetical protein